jgi:hypothetical protein
LDLEQLSGEYVCLHCGWRFSPDLVDGDISEDVNQQWEEMPIEDLARQVATDIEDVGRVRAWQERWKGRISALRWGSAMNKARRMGLLPMPVMETIPRQEPERETETPGETVTVDRKRWEDMLFDFGVLTGRQQAHHEQSVANHEILDRLEILLSWLLPIYLDAIMRRATKPSPENVRQPSPAGGVSLV